MANYKELHHSIGNDESGKRAWLSPKEKRTVNVDEKTAADLNAQFDNTGIKYELIEEIVEDKKTDDDVTPKDEPINDEGSKQNPVTETGDENKIINE